MSKLSLSKDKISFLLLEGIHDSAVELLRSRGYSNIESLPKALDDGALVEKIARAHVVGIRSRTQLTAPVLAAATRLFSIGCFCIGTNQVDLGAARRAGVPVFNAPHSNTRSVAEMVLAEIVMLLRGLHQRSAQVHRGEWPKSAKDSFEARGKVLGIIGYGHIGSQLSVLAEALGMRVRYYDIVRKLALGNAQPCHTLEELLQTSDLVSLHVPDTAATRGMIGAEQLRQMKPRSYLVNASRGTVVNIEALAQALRSRHLLGAAIDVFPSEPAGTDDVFESSLRGMDNVILTPHIGGSTLEAQANIGLEVADKLIEYSDNGSTIGAVNFPQVALPTREHAVGTRFLHLHRNVPGVLKRLNEVFAARNLNIAAQYLQTDPEVGYVVVDVDGAVDEDQVRDELRGIEGTIKVRFLY
ncbi:MAG: phosphoglycerate dehydrogenase [Rhodospirillaceae bacterium]